MADLIDTYSQDASNEIGKVNSLMDQTSSGSFFDIPGVSVKTIPAQQEPVDVDAAVSANITPPPQQVQAQSEDQQLSSAVVAAQKDPNISVSAHENTDPEDKDANSYTSPRGWSYEKPKDSHWNDAMLGMLGYMMGAANGGGEGDWMSGAVGAYSMVAENQDKLHRFNQIGYLESQKNADGTDKYGSKDIDNFVQSGDYTKLVENKVKWESAGSGYVFNPSTGVVVKGAGAGDKDTYGVSGNVMYNKATGKYEVIPGAKTQANRPPSLVATDANGNQTFSDGSVRDVNGNIIRQGITGSGTAPDTNDTGTQYDEPGSTPAYQGNTPAAPAQPSAGTPNTPYKDTATGTWMVPKVDTKTNTTTWSAAPAAQAKELESASTANSGAITTLENQQKTLNALAASPSFDDIYGTVAGTTPTIRQGSVDAEALRKQLSGEAFLQQRSLLKGQGAITDYESQRAEAAYTILTNPRISPEEAHKAAVELNGILNKGLRILRQKQDNINIPTAPQTGTAGTTPAAPAPAVAGTYVPGQGVSWH